MPNLKNIIYLSNEDYETLVSTGTVTIDGETLTYDENNVYVTPDKLVTTTEDGLMSCTDKVILDTINSAYIKNASVSNNTLTLTKQDGTVVTYTASSDNQTVKVGSTTFGANDAVDIVAGDNVTVTGLASGTGAPKITISATDTGATSVETTGSGNVVSSASYDASTRKLTLSKGVTALVAHQPIKTLKTDNTTAQSTSPSETIAGIGTINLHKVAKTGTYSDLIGTPTIPTVNDGTLTIQKNGTNVQTFTANQSGDVTANITVPTADSDLTNDRYVRYDTASQGLTSTQKSNARTNIGAGTSNLAIGTTATTAAAGNHTHTASISQSGSSGTSLAHNTWYTLTAGGSTVTFKTPSDNNTNYYATSNFTSSNGTKIATGHSGSSASTTYDLYAPNATATQAGLVTTGAQTFAGSKTFNASNGGSFYVTANNVSIIGGEDLDFSIGMSDALYISGYKEILGTSAFTGDFTVTANNTDSSNEIKFRTTSGTSGLGKYLVVPDTSSYTANKTIATTDDITIAGATDDILDATITNKSLKYAPYTSRSAGHLYTGTTNPSSTNRLNYDGYFYATKLYSNGSQVLTSESDTLATVTGRGASTSTAVTFNGGATFGDTIIASGGINGGTGVDDTLSLYNNDNADTSIVLDSSKATLSGNLVVSGTTDVTGGTLKLNAISAPTSSGGSTYGTGLIGQVLKANGRGQVYWASDSSNANYYAKTDFPSMAAANKYKIATGYSGTSTSSTYDLYVPYAEGSQAGLVSNLDQTFYGQKTFAQSDDTPIESVTQLSENSFFTVHDVGSDPVISAYFYADLLTEDRSFELPDSSGAFATVESITGYSNYSSSASYNVGNKVIYKGISYRCIQAGTGQTPSTSSSY